MLRNYFTIALRHLRQNRIFSIINVAGLAIGLACFILISLYVWNELHYDTYPAAADDIYRVEILAAPFTWWVMHVWLRDFAYRAPFAAWVFVLAGGVTALIALITVSSRAMRAALANPVEALRSE
jgi:ABC-type lipoprotein release transport system permease subunit